ncbi:MAG: hypothetical protein OXC07_09120 [Kistimonas sp.]|nr:hypothetical protein [Kistimonas sp.]
MKLDSIPIYSTLEQWQADCNAIGNACLEDDKPRVAEDGRLQAGAISPSGEERGFSRDGRLVGIRDAAGHQNDKMVQDRLNQMYRVTADLSRQAGIQTRDVELVSDQDMRRLTVKDLQGRLDRLLNSPGGQLVRMHESLNRMMVQVRDGDADVARQAIQQLPGLLRTSYQHFAQQVQSSGQAGSPLEQFGKSLQCWREETAEQLKHMSQSAAEEARTNPNFVKVCTLCDEFLAEQAKERAAVTTSPPDPAPSQKQALDLVPLLAGEKKRIDTMLAHIQQHFPEMTQERLLNLLCPSGSGFPLGFGNDSSMAEAIVAYAHLQRARPDAFPDSDFQMVRDLMGTRLRAPDKMPKDEVFQKWVSDSVSLKSLELKLQKYMPEQDWFLEYVSGQLPPHTLISEAIPRQWLDDYRDDLIEEAHSSVTKLGPKSLDDESLEQIAFDCCDKMLERFDSGYGL